MQLFLKILSGMANSVDLDQTADLGLHCVHMPCLTATLVYEILGHLLYLVSIVRSWGVGSQYLGLI